VGLVIGLSSIAAVATRVLSAGALDRRGRRPFALGGLALFAAATATLPLAASLGWLLALRAVQGVGWGFATTAISSLVADLAPAARRGEAIGIWGLAPTVAMALGPAAGAGLVRVGGPGAAFLGTAVLFVVALGLMVPVAEPRHVGPVRSGGVFPGGAFLPCAVLFLSSLSYGAIIAFVPVELGSEPGRTGTYFTVYATSILLVRPFAGRLSDRHGRRAVVVPGLLLGAVGVALTGLARGPLALAVAAALYGVGMSGLTFPALTAWTVDRSGEARGAAMAAFYGSYDLAIALGAFAFGPVYERFGFAAVNLAGAAGVVAAALLASFVSSSPPDLAGRESGRPPRALGD
jgi:MFS family permease